MKKQTTQTAPVVFGLVLAAIATLMGYSIFGVSGLTRKEEIAAAMLSGWVLVAIAAIVRLANVRASYRADGRYHVLMHAILCTVGLVVCTAWILTDVNGRFFGPQAWRVALMYSSGVLVAAISFADLRQWPTYQPLCRRTYENHGVE